MRIHLFGEPAVFITFCTDLYHRILWQTCDQHLNSANWSLQLRQSRSTISQLAINPNKLIEIGLYLYRSYIDECVKYFILMLRQCTWEGRILQNCASKPHHLFCSYYKQTRTSQLYDNSRTRHSTNFRPWQRMVQISHFTRKVKGNTSWLYLVDQIQRK